MSKWEAFAVGVGMTTFASLSYEHGMWWMCLIAAPILVWGFGRNIVQAIAAWREYLRSQK